MYFENLRFLFEFEIFLQSKYPGEFLFYITSRKSFFELGQVSKKRQTLPKLANIKRDCELRSNNENLLAEKRQLMHRSSILSKHYCTYALSILRAFSHQCITQSLRYTVVSENKATFICELILERYIYLRKTQKQLKITKYRGKSFS